MPALPGAVRRVLPACPRGAVKPVAVWLAVFSPAWVLGGLVAAHAVNIPVWDGWERALFLDRWREGTLTFADLYAPHIDHRIVFPRLLILLVAAVAQGDVRWEIGFTWCCGLATGIGVWRLARDTLGAKGWTAGPAFLANLWIFSPLQYDNWLWPIQTAFVLPLPCLVWAVWATLRPWAWWRRLALAGALAVIGTHSFSHGLFIWPAVGVLALLLPGGSPGAAGRWRFLAGWTALGALVVGCYFGIDYRAGTGYSYGRPVGDATPLAHTWRASLREFGTMWEFFLTMLGGPAVRQFAVDPVQPAARSGWLMLAGYAAAGGWALGRRCRGDREAWERALPWLALGGAVIAIALGTSVGRAAILAGARAAVPRFLTITLHLPLALLVVGRLAWLRNRGNPRVPRLEVPGWLLLGALVALQAQPWIYGRRLMELWTVSRWKAQAHVQFIEHFDPEPVRVLAYQVADVRRYAPMLDRMGLLEPPLVKHLRLDQFSRAKTTMAPARAAIDEIKPAAEGRPAGWNLVGHAILRPPSRPADAVIVTVEDESRGTVPEIVALGRYTGGQLPTRHRIDLQFTVLEELNEGESGSWMRWEATVPEEKLGPVRPLTLRVWAFDQPKRRAYPLGQRVVLGADGSATLRGAGSEGDGGPK